MRDDLWSMLFERSCDGLLELTSDGRICAANPTFLGWLAQPKQAVVGHLLGRFLDDEGQQPPFPLPGPVWAGILRLKGSQGSRLITLTLTGVETGPFSAVSLLGVARGAPDVTPLRETIRKAQDRLDTTHLVAINALGRLAEYHQPDIGGHLDRVRLYTYTLASSWAAQAGPHSLTENEIIELSRCSVLHDVGKVTISERVLAKTDGLTELEQSLLQSHALVGERILAGVESELKRLLDVPATFLTTAREIARSHHEWWDGGGYPEGLQGTEIPLSARIVALADVYDRLTAGQQVHPDVAHLRAQTQIVRLSGRQFDPQVVASFVACEAMFRAILTSVLEEPESPGEQAR